MPALAHRRKEGHRQRELDHVIILLHTRRKHEAQDNHHTASVHLSVCVHTSNTMAITRGRSQRCGCRCRSIAQARVERCVFGRTSKEKM